jgi:hypothetical protein
VSPQGERVLEAKRRLERIKHVGNLRMENLKSWYDRRAVFERYLKGTVELHAHLWTHPDLAAATTGERRPELCINLLAGPGESVHAEYPQVGGDPGRVVVSRRCLSGLQRSRKSAIQSFPLYG